MTTPTRADVGEHLRNVTAQLARADQAAEDGARRDAYRQASQHARQLWAALDTMATSPPDPAPGGMSLSFGGQIRPMPPL
jgi:hypothetical protein